MKMYQVDAFSQTLFAGNPAAVIVVEQWLDDAQMQRIAQENNLSETAFVKIIDTQNYQIRWFSPQIEINFCGHATLASAFVLFREFSSQRQIYFHVKNMGIFPVTLAEDGLIHMNFPQLIAQPITEYPSLLQQALTKPFKAVYRNAQAYIIEYHSVQDVLQEQPDFAVLAKLAQYKTAITAPNLDVAISALGQDFDCVSRYFAPANGINEDPVTGSIHTAIAPLWAEKLQKNQIKAFQASARGGELYCTLLPEQRIDIAGYAKLYMVAEIFLDE